MTGTQPPAPQRAPVTCGPVALVVQKYGGSSVASAAHMKRVAERIVSAKKNGDDVVVVVSAMGDSTDELLDLAGQITDDPPGRELDMLLTAGERISMALLPTPPPPHRHLHARLRGALLHGLAGRRHHHRQPRQGPDHRRHPGPLALGAGRGLDR